MIRISINSSLCTGCRKCEGVCALERRVRDLSPFPAIRVNLQPFTGKTTLVYCRHCSDAPCAAVCGGGALRRNPETGAVELNETLCTACGACAAACPFEAIFPAGDKAPPVKCDLCGGNPLCAGACAFQAIELVTL